VVRGREERLIDTAASQAIGERLLALITPQPRSQRIVRRAWRSAQRLGAELDLLWVAGHEPTDEEREQLEGLRRLASVLGAHLLVERGDDVALSTQRVAHERGTTYILMGTPRPRSALRRLTQAALPYRLLGLLPGVDLRIVADRAQMAKEEP
jgi:two-component system, OmpR family, sensor histidine kinase KdpD